MYEVTCASYLMDIESITSMIVSDETTEPVVSNDNNLAISLMRNTNTFTTAAIFYNKL